jgi:hypothetical protein
MPHRLVHVVADVGEGLDLRHQGGDLLDRHAEQLAGHVDVLATGEIRMEAHAQFEQGGDAAFHVDAAGGRLGGPGDQLEQGALAGAVDADQADRLARGDAEADVLQHPLELVARAAGQHPFGQARPARRVLFIGLAQA